MLYQIQTKLTLPEWNREWNSRFEAFTTPGKRDDELFGDAGQLLLNAFIAPWGLNQRVLVGDLCPDFDIHIAESFLSWWCMDGDGYIATLADVEQFWKNQTLKV